jgi:hypothetical protein
MSGIDASIIQDLVDQIEALKKDLESLGDEGQVKLKTISLDDVIKGVPHTPDGKLDANAWRGLGEEGQRERCAKLSGVLDALKEAATCGAEKQPGGYGEALIATLIFLPVTATFFTVILVLVEWPTNYFLAPVWGLLGAFAAWFVLGPLFCEFVDAKHAIPSSYGELLPRLDELEIGLKGFCPVTESSKNPVKNTAYHEAVKAIDEIRKDLAVKGLPWALATGYTKVWGRLYRAEEALIEFAPEKKVLEGAYYDEERLEGSDIKNRDDLLGKLRKAVVSLDPSAAKYLKSTAGVSKPPALAIGTTALPGGTVAVGYSLPLLAIGGVTPYKWAVIRGAIPDGLVFSSGGVLRGTPTSDGHGHFTIQVGDSAGVVVEKYFDLIVSPQTQATKFPLAISTTSPLPWGTVNVDYHERLFATGGTPPYKWAVVEGAIPDGLQLSDAGVLSQRPVRDNAFNFKVEVSDSTGKSTIAREFSLLIKPSEAVADVPVEDTESKQLARAVLRHVRNSLNEYRNTRWNGLVLARNRLLATFMVTGMIVFALLAIAILSRAERLTIIAATVFYLVGATTGLCNRLRSESQAESAIPDYGLSAARLITIPLFSGLGAIGGLLFVAYLPFVSPVFGPDKQPHAQASTPSVVEKAPTKATKQAVATAEEAILKVPAQADDGDATPPTPERVPPTPQKLEDIFNLQKNLIGLFVAMVFGLTPGLLFDRLQQQADRYKADLKNSQSTEGTKKS